MNQEISNHVEDIIFDDGDKIEIECSYASIEDGIAALHADPRYS